MPHSAEISRANPACFLFIIDQSYSMNEQFGSTSGITKAQFVANRLNQTLYNLVLMCSKGVEIRDYFDIGVIGYGGDGVGPALSGALSGRRLVRVSEVGNHPLRLDVQRQMSTDSAGRRVELDVQVPVWFEPAFSGGTPMYEAFSLAKNILLGWVATHQDSHPPVVLHVTDGDWNGTDPSKVADDIRALTTNDGSVVMLHLHVSSSDAEPVLFPNSADILPADRFARDLFYMSSQLTPQMVQQARSIESLQRHVSQGSRGYVFNGGIEDVINFFEIGTRTSRVAGNNP